MKPFDLEAALNGEPVKLANGSKAHIVFKFDNPFLASYALVGFEIMDKHNNAQHLQYWTINGVSHSVSADEYHIIGMWED